MKLRIIMVLLCCGLAKGLVAQKELETLRNSYAKISFKYDEIKGIGHEKGCTRRDPSDVIKIGDTWYVYYTKVYGRSPGYWGTIWYATSTDEGYSWKEQGEILGTGQKGAFDSHATFTSNILGSERRYIIKLGAAWWRICWVSLCALDANTQGLLYNSLCYIR